jgi:hypothetical protein
MEPRYLASALDELCFQTHKMALVSGPRQCGKTTLARMLLRERGAGGYHNWDDVELRRRWTKNPGSLWPSGSGAGVPLMVLDEIHKARGWKRTLKGLYDTRPSLGDVLVTGSARLNVYKKGGDSLLGRAFHFRLHPFSQAELARKRLPGEPEVRLDFLRNRALKKVGGDVALFDSLLRFGGFPEPFLAANERKARLWRRSRIEKVIREDLRDLTRLPELSRVEMLAALLPERVGSLLSRNSLREDLEVSFDAVSRWLSALGELYYAFEIRPYATSVARSLKKEGKLYLWDWSEVANPGARFENMIGCHLLKACDFWTDTGEGTFELRLLRNREKEEIDFLILRDGKPWLPVEAKISEATPVSHWRKFLGYLKVPTALQVVATPHVWNVHRVGDSQLIVASASEILGYFV